jgi:hypothetical protein
VPPISDTELPLWARKVPIAPALGVTDRVSHLYRTAGCGMLVSWMRPLS